MRVGRGSEGRAVKTRVLAREGWFGRRCWRCWWLWGEERDMVTSLVDGQGCFCTPAKTTLLLHGGVLKIEGMRDETRRRELRLAGVERPMRPRWAGG